MLETWACCVGLNFSILGNNTKCIKSDSSCRQYLYSWFIWSCKSGNSLLLLQSALQPLWVMSCSTIVDYSQHEGFYRVPLPAARQTPNLGDQWFSTFQLPPPDVPHVWNDASEPQQRKVELWEKNCREFCRKWRLPRHFWVLLHAVNLRYGTDGFTSLPKEGALRIFFSPDKSDGFGRVWTRELGYQRPARSPSDHRSRCNLATMYVLNSVLSGWILTSFFFNYKYPFWIALKQKIKAFNSSLTSEIT